ncbi:VanZ family protein [Lysobacter psychrotolerans]|uniref:VanZ family protein n=1 Tax=Montanilutibacter psychrotolerans TaxID=1327343 RepID=A0A3M8SQ71_9GAMM|nr:VanZ family protein [Lysobacter psychrotolerans]
MHRFRRPWLWVGGWVAMIALVAVGSLMSASHLPSPPFHGVDKLEHVVGYALLSGYAAMLFVRLRPRALAAAGLVGYGIGIEFAQAALTTTRMADPADMVANTVGVLIGLLFAATPAARWLQRLDGRLG